LVIGYIIAQWKGKGPSSYEQMTYFIAWLLATIINTLQFMGVVSEKYSALIVGLGIIISVITVSIYSNKFVKSQ
jgi:hypothetical protein